MYISCVLESVTARKIDGKDKRHGSWDFPATKSGKEKELAGKGCRHGTKTSNTWDLLK